MDVFSETCEKSFCSKCKTKCGNKGVKKCSCNTKCTECVCTCAGEAETDKAIQMDSKLNTETKVEDTACLENQDSK